MEPALGTRVKIDERPDAKLRQLHAVVVGADAPAVLDEDGVELSRP